MRVVVTGAGGFVGWHLVDALAHRGDHVEAWVRKPGGDWHTGVQPTAVEITNPESVTKAMQRAAPELVVHLAAQSLPGRSWEDPAETYRVNVLGTVSLLEAIRALKPRPRLLLAGSSAEYAEPTNSLPIAENGVLEPNSPYAASKLAADELAQLYGRRYGLEIVRVRPFLLIGPRKAGDVCSDFARQIVAIERGRETTMHVGRLDVVRDFLDVRDGVAAILRLIEAGRPGELYNVCSGRGVSIAEVLAGYRKLAIVQLSVIEDKALLRPLDQRTKIGDPAKLKRLGWTPLHELGDSLRSILDYWRARTA